MSKAAVPLSFVSVVLAAAVATAALAPGCGGSIGAFAGSVMAGPDGSDGPPMLVPDAPSATAPIDGAIADAGCAPVDANLPAPPASKCTSAKRACTIDMNVGPSACRTTRFAASVEPMLAPCGAMCARVLVGISGGCVSDVVSQDGASDIFAACAFKNLLGSSWDCAPADGWLPLTFGACLAP